jgi:DEAD/DEAH box helicase domain-containing protein
MDRPSAKELIFENAVYMHRGRQYLVESLDIENRKCLVREAELNYFTDGLVKTDIKVLSEDEEYTCGEVESEQGEVRSWETGKCGVSESPPASPTTHYSLLPSHYSPLPSPYPLLTIHYSAKGIVGDVLVRSQVTRFKKIRFHTHENIGYGDISLPEEEMQTRSLILLFGPETRGGGILASLDEEDAGSVLSGAGTLIKLIAPVFLLCDPRDIGVAERVRDPHFGIPALYIYDKYPGGTGLSEALARRTEELFPSIYRAVENCPCKTGCPSCVGPGGNKEGARLFLGALQSRSN